MTFAIPSVSDLVAKARGAFASDLAGVDAWIPGNNVYVTAKVFGGYLWSLFGRLQWVLDQAFALTATGTWLERHGAQYGIQRKPAALASGAIVITATDACVFPAGTVFARSDGVSYISTADAALAVAGSVTVAGMATAAGASANGDAGTPLAITAGPTPPSGAGVATALAAIAPGGFAQGLDVEDDGEPHSSDLSTLRGRILWRLRNPPRGGAPADYVTWGTAVPGCTRIFVERCWMGAGTARIFPLFDGLFAGGVPDEAHVQLVRDAFVAVQPGTAQITTVAPTPLPIDVTVANLSPLTSAVEQAIRDELISAFARLGAVSGSDAAVVGMPYLASPQTFSRSWLGQAISDATGEQRHVLTAPAGDVAIPAGSIPVLGALTFV